MVTFRFPSLLTYDGEKKNAVEEAFCKLGGKDLYVEAWAEFEKELAVMVRTILCDPPPSPDLHLRRPS